MRARTFLKWTLLVIVIAGIEFSSLSIIFLTLGLPGVDSAAMITVENSALPVPAAPGLPVRLRIPSIRVDAAVEAVGLTAAGAMDTPKETNDVAWFHPGPRPGEAGSAVIAGHFGWEDGKALVFNDLSTLHQGDIVQVEDGYGITLSFVVRETRNYDPAADASEIFTSSDGKAHLNLITCEGVWNVQEQQYSNRLVIFTERTENGEKN